eukprot:s3324_g5.t1
MACATICHTKSEANFVSGILSTKLMSMARAGDYKIQGFPDFRGALGQLQAFQRAPAPEYDVCVPVSGALIIKQSLIEFWTKKHASFEDQMLQLIQDHNAEFNPKGLKRGAEDIAEQEEENPEPAAKRLRLSTTTTLADLDSQCKDRLGYYI